MRPTLTRFRGWWWLAGIAACARSHVAAPPGASPTADAGALDSAWEDVSRDASPESDALAPAECVRWGWPEPLDLAFVVRLERADLLLLVDVTASMGQEIAVLREHFRDSLGPGIEASFPDARVALGTVSDFGRSSGIFWLAAPITADWVEVQEALDGLRLTDGGDGPEAQVPALWMVATGEGRPPSIPAATCPEETIGYPCFRRDAGRFVLLVSDAAFHNGPEGAYPYEDPELATYPEAVAALGQAGIRVAGLYSGLPDGPGLEHQRRLATDTRAVDAEREPLVEVVSRDGEGLAQGFLRVVRALADEMPLDVRLRLADLPGDSGDLVDLVDSVEAGEAEPADGARRAGSGFAEVRPGTRISFRVRFHGSAQLPPGARYRLRAEVVTGDGVPVAVRTVELAATCDGS